MAPKCPLYRNAKVLCRIKPESQHRWVGAEQQWYLRNYCESDYYVDCEDFEAFREQQAIVKGKILVVDDEQAFLDTLQTFFSSRGYQMLTAPSAEKALELIKLEQPALACIDMKLPGLNGIELIKILKRECPGTKLFVITAYDEENKHAVEALGIDAFFAKPVGLNQLKNQVVEALAATERRLQPFVEGRALEGAPKAKLLFVLERLPNEVDRLSGYLRQVFADVAQSGGEYQTEFAYSTAEALEKLIAFKPDFVLVNFDSLYEIPCGQLALRIIESPYRPKEVMVYGLNLEASDKRKLEALGVQYVDQRKGFAKLTAAVKRMALQHRLRRGDSKPVETP